MALLMGARSRPQRLLAFLGMDSHAAFQAVFGAVAHQNVAYIASRIRIVGIVGRRTATAHVVT
eukprot:6019690-Lingulodinium_polyedra.AAC.1